MLRDCGVSSVWECGSKNFPPFLLSRPLALWVGRLMLNRFQGDVVASLCLVLEKALAVNILAAAGSLPVFLLVVLGSHPIEEVTAHPVVVVVGFVAVGVVFDELVG